MDKEGELSEHAERAIVADPPDPDALTTATVGIVGTILVIAAVVFLQGLYESVNRREFRRKIVDEAPTELTELRAAQLRRLSATAWVDKQNGIVAIPIEKAMALLVANPSWAAPIIVPAPPEAKGAAPESQK
jgi:hypothetical protein